MIKRKGGFTLIELLVVIAIIAILAAILFPVFINAKFQAQQAKCQSNLKQIAMAALRYSDDYDGRLPYTIFTNFPSLYGPYISKTSRDKGVLICPMKQAYPWNYYLWGTPDNVPGSGNRGFPNCDLYAPSGYIPGVGGPGRSVGSIRNPARTPCTFDGMIMKDDDKTGDAFYSWGWDIADAFNSTRMTNLHSDGSNYAFVDGHVKYYRAVKQNLGAKTVYIQFNGFDYDGDGRDGGNGVIR